MTKIAPADQALQTRELVQPSLYSTARAAADGFTSDQADIPVAPTTEAMPRQSQGSMRAMLRRGQLVRLPRALVEHVASHLNNTLSVRSDFRAEPLQNLRGYATRHQLKILAYEHNGELKYLVERKPKSFSAVSSLPYKSSEVLDLMRGQFPDQSFGTDNVIFKDWDPKSFNEVSTDGELKGSIDGHSSGILGGAKPNANLKKAKENSVALQAWLKNELSGLTAQYGEQAGWTESMEACQNSLEQAVNTTQNSIQFGHIHVIVADLYSLKQAMLKLQEVPLGQSQGGFNTTIEESDSAIEMQAVTLGQPQGNFNTIIKDSDSAIEMQAIPLGQLRERFNTIIKKLDDAIESINKLLGKSKPTEVIHVALVPLENVFPERFAFRLNENDKHLTFVNFARENDKLKAVVNNEGILTEQVQKKCNLAPGFTRVGIALGSDKKNYLVPLRVDGTVIDGVILTPNDFAQGAFTPTSKNVNAKKIIEITPNPPIAYSTFNQPKSKNICIVDQSEGNKEGVGVVVISKPMNSLNRTAPVRDFDKYGNEIVYRRMSVADHAELRSKNEVPLSIETTFSPAIEYSSKYDGVMVKFVLKKGTMEKLEGIGMPDNLTNPEAVGLLGDEGKTRREQWDIIDKKYKSTKSWETYKQACKDAEVSKTTAPPRPADMPVWGKDSVVFKYESGQMSMLLGSDPSGPGPKIFHSGLLMYEAIDLPARPNTNP